MKRKTSMLISLTLILALMCSPVRAANEIGTATGRFTDVPTDSQYTYAIETLAGNGIIGGVGDSNFAPDRLITYNETVTILSRLYRGGVFTLPGGMTPDMFRENVTWENAAKLAFDFIDISSYYPWQLCESPIYQNDAMNAANMLGAYVNAAPVLGGYMTRAEFAYFIYMFNAGIISNPRSTLPASLSRIERIAYENNHNTDVLRALVAAEIVDIPDYFIKLFNESNFTLIFSNQPANHYEGLLSAGTRLTGLTTTTMFGNKVGLGELLLFQDEHTKVCGASSLFHEMGHVIAYSTGIRNTDAFNAMFVTDVTGAVRLTRDYAKTNPDECWAECFKYLITNRNDAAKMAEAENLIPSSYAYFQSLMTQSHAYDQTKAA